MPSDVALYRVDRQSKPLGYDGRLHTCASQSVYLFRGTFLHQKHLLHLTDKKGGLVQGVQQNIFLLTDMTYITLN